MPAVAPKLTARQIEVLQLNWDGHSRAEAAADLGCSLNTVREHLHASRLRLGLPPGTRTLRILTAAAQAGLIRK
jgi:DNA-binding NarL/FixJ family response regulator